MAKDTKFNAPKQGRRRSRIAKVAENLANQRAIVEAGDDPQVAAALGGDERQHFIDARQQECPDATRGLAVGGFGGRSSGVFCTVAHATVAEAVSAIAVGGATSAVTPASAVTAARSGALGASTPT